MENGKLLLLFVIRILKKMYLIFVHLKLDIYNIAYTLEDSQIVCQLLLFLISQNLFFGKRLRSGRAFSRLDCAVAHLKKKFYMWTN
jgi:hypothetical protein